MRGVSVILVLFGVLLAMAQMSIEEDLENPIRMPVDDDDMIEPNSVGDDDRIEGKILGAFGVIVTSYDAEKALNDSGRFKPSSYVDLYGRRFVIGKIFGADVVYVRSAYAPSVHVGVTVQILVNTFNIRGIINFGTAGTTNETIRIGTVVVPVQIAFTGAFQWLPKDSKKVGQLNIGDFNYPTKGENLLGSFFYGKIDTYINGKRSRKYWIPVSPGYTMFASLIQPLESSLYVIVGTNASSSDIYVNNPAYREFLYKQFRVSTVDTEGAAIALAALSSDIPYIVFHGVSNKAGAGSGETNNTLAYANAVKAATRFIFLRRCY